MDRYVSRGGDGLPDQPPRSWSPSRPPRETSLQGDPSLENGRDRRGEVMGEPTSSQRRVPFSDSMESVIYSDPDTPMPDVPLDDTSRDDTSRYIAYLYEQRKAAQHKAAQHKAAQLIHRVDRVEERENRDIPHSPYSPHVLQRVDKRSQHRVNIVAPDSLDTIATAAQNRKEIVNAYRKAKLLTGERYAIINILVNLEDENYRPRRSQDIAYIRSLEQLSYRDEQRVLAEFIINWRYDAVKHILQSHNHEEVKRILQSDNCGETKLMEEGIS